MHQSPGRHPSRRAFWESRALRVAAVVTLLALSGLVILALVRQQTGTQGFLVGLGLAVLPVPLLVAAFRWLDRVEPEPWRNLLFAFAWGACAATLVAIIANSFASQWIFSRVDLSSPTDADTYGATIVAPVVEESAKAAALLLIHVFRRRGVAGVVDGVVIAGITATGFAFTENILYLGNAFGEDQNLGFSGLRSATVATFFVRIVMAPFAHPLFTALTGIGFGLAALVSPRRRVVRALLPLAGLLLAMGLHSVWNASSTLGGYGFIGVYGLIMVPLFGLLTGLVIRSRGNELRTVRAQLPAYVAAGWLVPSEPYALSSMRVRSLARSLARSAHGPAAARAVAEYQACATALAILRQRALRGAVGADFTAREQELLDRLWQRKAVAQPALDHALARTFPVPVYVPGAMPGYAPLPPSVPRQWTHHPANGAGYGGPGPGAGTGVWPHRPPHQQPPHAPSYGAAAGHRPGDGTPHPPPVPSRPPVPPASPPHGPRSTTR